VTTTLAFAGILAGAALIAALAPTFALACIVSLAGVLLGRGASAFTLASVLSLTASVTGLATTLALAFIQAFAGVLVALLIARVFRAALLFSACATCGQSSEEAERCRRNHFLTEFTTTFISVGLAHLELSPCKGLAFLNPKLHIR